jgi:hypothetical protein
MGSQGSIVLRKHRTPRNRRRRSCRTAITILEVTLAAALFSILLATSLRMFRVVESRQLAGERRDCALQAAQAVLEQIGNIPWSGLTPDAVKQIKVPDAIAKRLPGSDVSVALSDETEPTAKRVRVDVSWQTPNQQTSSVNLTSWIFPEQTQ